jgi:hypothetical protein
MLSTRLEVAACSGYRRNRRDLHLIEPSGASRCEVELNPAYLSSQSALRLCVL